MVESQTLRRELGVPSATLLGLGSILGTGVFVSIGLVAGLANGWTPLVVLMAALVATCNALSSAQLAAAHPRSGGTYEYGYRLLHPMAGFTAGWMFLCAKSASAATAALGFAGYLLNLLGVEDHRAVVWLGAGIVVVLTALVAGGLRRSNVVNTVVVSVTVLALVAFVASGLSRAWANWGEPPSSSDPSLRTLLEATALMFVAYTGYGRVATLGEEVRDPARTIPRAIVATLYVSAALYLAVAFVAVNAVGSEAFLAATEGLAAPLEVISRSFGWSGIPVFVGLGAVTAMAGVLLNLLLGLSRVLLAMGRRGDMPSAVTKVDAQRSSPFVAVIVVGAIILSLTLIGSIRTAWSFSAFTVLVYYALTNLAALRLAPEQRLYSRAWSVGGLASCAFLAFWVEPKIWMVGLGLIGVGMIWHLIARRSGPA
jgi:APA family basic amino acid/polyamine antiporter